jgi:hypothetical protein
MEEITMTTYTKPELRDRIKKQVMAGSKGGDAGEWSARKAQLVAQKYEAAGGGYSGGKTGEQKSLSKWTKEDWKTSDGKPSEGKKRYLPAKAWDSLSPSEKASTNKAKSQGNKQGKQFVPQPKKIAQKTKVFRRP